VIVKGTPFAHADGQLVITVVDKDSTLAEVASYPGDCAPSDPNTTPPPPVP